MKKNIIISGKAGSGKTHISAAITSISTLTLVYHDKVRLKQGLKRNQLKVLYNRQVLIILEEAKEKDIIPTMKIVNNFFPSDCFFPLNIKVVFVTQDEVSPSKFEKFHVINCNNNCVN